MAQIRAEADEAQAKVQDLQTKVKTLEQENLQKEQEIKSLSHKNQVLETEVDKLEEGIKEAKRIAAEGSQHGTQNESLQRRLQLLEEEAEEADKNLRETNEKYGHRTMHLWSLFTLSTSFLPIILIVTFSLRLRQTDVKAGHYERKVQALELARDQMEAKYEEMSKKYAKAQKEIEDFNIELGNM